MSDADAALADMDRAGVAVRVLSAPPFAFPVVDAPGAAGYADDFNAELGAVVARSGGRLVGLGMVALGDRDRVTRQLDAMAAADGIAGVAIPRWSTGIPWTPIRCGMSSPRRPGWTWRFWSIPCSWRARSGRVLPGQPDRQPGRVRDRRRQRSC